MYRKADPSNLTPEKFELPIGTKLSQENRWVVMANLIPWEEFEEEYARLFSEEMGAPALPFRMALGSLIIKEKLGISDRETVEQIRENPYLQYFIGLKSYSFEAHYNASMLVHFRKRMNLEFVNKVTEEMVKRVREKTEVKEEKSRSDGEEIGEIKNRGKLILDATCAPADIKYPTDLNLLNQARKETEKIIDILYAPLKGILKKKPRTHRRTARKEYLKVAKKRRPSQKERREAIEKQLQYINRNLKHIEKLIEEGAKLESLNKRQLTALLVVKKIYEQQFEMWSNNTQSVEKRIVSLTQPHIRPIVRGKAGKPTEFGAKLSVSCVDNYVFLDRLSWENFNESGDLVAQVEKFKKTYGCYPESVHVDQIYRTRYNRAWCKERGIRISGPPLGRPPKNVSQEQKKQAQYDESFRNAIEGKFGQGKRRFSLNLLMTKLKETSETAIAISFLVINLSKLLRQFLRLFLSLFIQTRTRPLKGRGYFNKNYIKAILQQQNLCLRGQIIGS